LLFYFCVLKDKGSIGYDKTLWVIGDMISRVPELW